MDYIKYLDLTNFGYDVETEQFMVWNKNKCLWVRDTDEFVIQVMQKLNSLASQVPDPTLRSIITRVQIGTDVKRELKLKIMTKVNNKSKLIPTKNGMVIDTETDQIRKRVKEDNFTFTLNVSYRDDIPESALVINYIKERQLELLLKPLYLSLINSENRSHIIVFRNIQYSGLSTLLQILFHMFDYCWLREYDSDQTINSSVRCIFSKNQKQLPLSLLAHNFNYCIVVDKEEWIPNRSVIHVVELHPFTEIDTKFFSKWEQADFDYFFYLIVKAGRNC